MYLLIENTRTQLYGAREDQLEVLDRYLRYPTALAGPIEKGSLPPVVDTGGWNGWARCLHRPKTMPPWVPTGLLGYVRYYAQCYRWQLVEDDRRQRPALDIPEVTARIELRPYQQQAVERALALGRGVIDCPPRSGKTRMGAAIQRALNTTTVWIAPTDRIVEQTTEVLTGFFGRGYVTHQVGSRGIAEAGRVKVVCATAATAANLPAEFYRTRNCLIIDEFHHSAAASYRTIFSLCDHVYYRYGMTGTFFRSGADAMAMHALLSETIYKISPQELRQLGFLVPAHVVFLPVPSPHLRGCAGKSFQAGHGKLGIHEHDTRNQLVAWVAYYLARLGRRVLILIGTKKQGYLIRDLLRGYLGVAESPGVYQAVEFLSTDTDRGRQGEVLKAYEQGSTIKVLIGTTLLGEGVDLPTADALVYARGEQAEVSLTQSMYRVVTATGGKRAAIVVDFCDRHHKKLLEHAEERLRVYFEEPLFSVEVLQDIRQFPGWLENLLPKIGVAALSSCAGAAVC